MITFILMRHATQSARANGEAITHHNVVGDGKRRLEVETKICICAEMEKLFDEVRFLMKWGSVSRSVGAE